MITVLIVALVLGAYYYPSAPKMLKDNKQMLLGVFVGLLMGQYLGVKIEGIGGRIDLFNENPKTTAVLSEHVESGDIGIKNFLTGLAGEN